MPDYPKLAQLWWKNVAVAVTGEKTPQAGDGQPGRGDGPGDGAPRARRHGALRAEAEPEGATRTKWLSDKGAPWKKLANEKPKGETIAYETLLNAWKDGKVR